MGVRQPADYHFWGERNAVIGVFLETLIMQHTINLNLMKENPELFFSKLPEKAEMEMLEFLNFLAFKYKISFDYCDNKPRFKNFVETPIKVKNKIKYSREEIHER